MTEEPDNDSFFGFDKAEDYDDEVVDHRSRWLTVGIIIIAIISSVFLGIQGARSLSAASSHAGYEDRTWVLTGAYKDLTPDLKTKDNVAIYTGKLPVDQQLDNKLFISELGDPVTVHAGEMIEFRGSEAGRVRADFPQEVDALLATTEGNSIEVIRTGAKGTLKPITAEVVFSERLSGWAYIIGAFVIFAGGIFASVKINRRRSIVEDDEY
ncbi:hypothetical protein ACN08Z_03585 [Rothia sp. P7181]|uniref:hypothetical protein n=1 Tax=unclassified Rothia (in: high G+C Gram-positive bacteria) TaxID=2689056 RepID=UPI003ABE8B65